MNNKELISVLTGANGLIGKEIAKGLIIKHSEVSSTPLKLVLVCRSNEKIHEVQSFLLEHFKKLPSSKINQNGSELNIEFSKSSTSVVGRVADLSSYKSTHELISQLKSDFSHIDILLNNAAAVTNNKQLSKDGLELQWGVNVMSYYWLTYGLQDLLSKSIPHSHVVFVASNYAGYLDLNDVNFEKRPYSTNVAYQTTKQANRMLSKAFSDYFQSKNLPIMVNSCHPGVTTSPLLKGLGMKEGWDTASDSAKQPIALCFGDIGTGAYYSYQKKTVCEFSKNANDVKRLFEICNEITDKVKQQ